jgi:hypothetical protein
MFCVRYCKCPVHPFKTHFPVINNVALVKQNRIKTVFIEVNHKFKISQSAANRYYSTPLSISKLLENSHV